MKKHIFLIIFVILLQMVAFSACKNNDMIYLQPSSSDNTSNNENDSVPLDTKIDELTDEEDIQAEAETNSKDAATFPKKETNDTNSTSNKITETKKPNTASKNETTGSSNNNSKPSNQESTTPSLNEGSTEKTTLTYEEYLNLTPAKQQEYFKTFDSLNSFKEWLNTAKAEYDAKDDSIEVEGNGSLDLKDYLD